MTNKHMKRALTLLIIGEIKIKTTVRYYFTSIRVSTIKQTRKKEQKITNGGKGMEKLEYFLCTVVQI